MPRHVHPQHDELILVVGGELLATLHTRAGDSHLVGSIGKVLHYPAGVPHTETATGDRPLETIFVSFMRPAHMAIAPITSDSSGHLLGAFRWLLALLATDRPTDRASAQHVFDAVLHELTCNHTGADSDLVRRTERYVRYHLAEDISLDALADHAGLSKYHFARAFRMATGETPMAYVRNARLNTAARLLRDGSMPLRVVAHLVGFRDQTQLCRVFRRQAKRTPGAFRQA